MPSFLPPEYSVLLAAGRKISLHFQVSWHNIRPGKLILGRIKQACCWAQ